MGLDVNSSRVQMAGQSPQAPPGPAENAAPRQDRVDAFQEALQGKEEGKGGEKNFAGQEPAGERGEKEETVALSASSLMESLFGSRMRTRDVTGTAGADHPSALSARTVETAELVDKLVDRILVSEPGKGAREVRIALGDKALPGTEVSLSRAPDGQLSVRICSTDPSSFQTLVGAQDALRTALERQGETVRVEVTSSDGGGPDDGDARRRSRGYLNFPSDEER